MILEAIVTTINEDGSTNISPMGPTVTADLSQFVLRPFDTSTTFANCLLYTSPSPRDQRGSRMPSSA